jgi:hypothetical protein
MDNHQDIFRLTGEEVGGFGNDTVLGFEPGLDKIEFGFDILLNFNPDNAPADELSLKNFEVLDFYPNGIELGSDDLLTDLDFPFVEQINGDLLIHLPPSGDVALDGEGIHTGTIEYQIDGQIVNYDGATLLIEGVNSLAETDFMFFS